MTLRPNANTLVLATVLAAMWYTGASQGNGAAYALFALLLGLAIVGTIHAWINLHGVTLQAGPIPPVAAGEQGTVEVILRATGWRTRYGLSVANRGGPDGAALPPLPPGESMKVEVMLPALARGRYDSCDLVVQSAYPLGFCTAQASFHVAERHYVYPRPDGDAPLPVQRGEAMGETADGMGEGQDFAGVRAYRTGESMRHIDWRAVARGQPLLIKQWSTEGGDDLVLRWDDLPDLPVEQRLSQLARWITKAENQGALWTLTLPGHPEIRGRGAGHFHRAMQILAEWPAASNP